MSIEEIEVLMCIRDNKPTIYKSQTARFTRPQAVFHVIKNTSINFLYLDYVEVAVEKLILLQLIREPKEDNTPNLAYELTAKGNAVVTKHLADETKRINKENLELKLMGSSNVNNKVTPWIAGFAALITLIGFIREIALDRQQQRTIQQLQQQMKAIDSSLQNQQKQFAPLLKVQNDTVSTPN